MLNFIKFILLSLIGVVIVSFAMSNRTIVPIHFPITSFSLELPLFLFFFAAIIIGLLIGLLFSVKYRIGLFFKKPN